MKVRDYALGAWESLNYVLRFLKEHDKDESMAEFHSLKEQLEEGVAVDFHRKLTMI